MKHKSTHINLELALLISMGSQEAFRELFDTYRNKVFSIACNFTGTEAIAEDLMQEIFIKIWLNKEKLANVDNLDSYLNAVIRNHIFNFLRKAALENRIKGELSIEKEEGNKEIYSRVDYKELEILVHKAVNKLPLQQRKVYQFSRYQGLKHEEISAKMGISRSTVKGHMVEALSSIRKYLTAHGEVITVWLVFLKLHQNL